jgi:chromosome segregation ATPase
MQSFRYTLEPVLTKSRWDLDTASSELAAARRHVVHCDRAVAETRASLASLCDEFERIRSHSSGLLLHKEAALRQYGERVAALLQQRLAAQQEAQALHNRLADQARKALQVVRGMERHKDRLRDEHDAGQRSTEQKQADDGWLMSHPVPLESRE